MNDSELQKLSRQWTDWIAAEDFAAFIVTDGTWRASLAITPDGVDFDRSPLVQALYQAAGR